MATAKWIGASLNRRQVDTITIANTWTDTVDTITLTINSVDFIVTIGTLNATTEVSLTLQQAISGTTFTDTTASATVSIADGGGNSIPLFSEFTATVSASVVTLTSNGSGVLAGKPWTLSVTESTSGDGTATEATTIAATSQYHANQVDNWHLNAVPGNGDTVIFDTGNVDVRYLLELGAITVAQLTKYKSYTGNVGLPRTNTDNSAKPYSEYRTPMYLTADGFTIADLEVGEGPGSSRFYLDAGSVASTFNVYGKGTRVENGVPCILLLGTSTSNVLRNLAGDVGVAFYGGEASALATLITGDGPASQASTICGAGVSTLTAATLNGGFHETNSAVGTATQNAGTWVHKLGTVTALNLNGGVFYNNGAATITTLNLYGGSFDASKGTASFAITNTVQMYKGAKFIDPQGRTGNVVIKLNGCTFSDVTIVHPFNKTYTPS